MHQMTRAMNYTCKFTTGDLSSSCEMINLRNKSRSEVKEFVHRRLKVTSGLNWKFLKQTAA